MSEKARFEAIHEDGTIETLIKGGEFLTIMLKKSEAPEENESEDKMSTFLKASQLE